MIRMDFSFYMPVYNEESLIGETLDRLIAHIKKYKASAEILVEIDGNDNTAAIARSFTKKFRNLYIFHPKRRMGRIRAMNFLIQESKGKLIVNNDVDLIFVGNLDKILKRFEDRNVGGLVLLDSLTRDSINDGQRIFEKTYNELKLKRHTVNNAITSPIFYTKVVRKLALQRPYVETSNDDTEITEKLLRNGYKIIYDRDLAYQFVDNPKMPRLTPIGMLKRRARSEIFRREASSILNTSEFALKNRIYDFVSAVAISITKCSPSEFIGLLEYLIMVFVGTAAGKLSMLVFKDQNAWKYRAR